MTSAANARSLIAMGAFAMAGNTPLVAQPMVVGAMVDLLGMTERQAGIMASVELTGLTLGILAVMPAVTRVKRSNLAVFAVSTIIAANLMTCFVSGFWTLLPIRFLSGVGAASAFCVYMNLAASSERPENAFAIVNAISIAYSGLVNLLAPYLLQAAGLPGILVVLSVITSFALVTLPWFATLQLSGIRPTASTLGASARALLLPLLGMMLLLYTGHGAIWGYQERIGVAAGLSETTVGTWLGLSMLVWGVGGSLFARVMSLSIGRMWPQIVSLGASCLAALILVYGTTPLSFAASSALIAFSWFYGLPYQMGLLAARDRQGRVALAGVMMSTGGMALGPGIAAFLISGNAHQEIGIFSSVCYLAALAIAIPATRRLNRMARVVAA
jgi:predicted MFS family arabinose efflux permease